MVWLWVFCYTFIQQVCRNVGTSKVKMVQNQFLWIYILQTFEHWSMYWCIFLWLTLYGQNWTLNYKLLDFPRSLNSFCNRFKGTLKLLSEIRLQFVWVCFSGRLLNSDISYKNEYQCENPRSRVFNKKPFHDQNYQNYLKATSPINVLLYKHQDQDVKRYEHILSKEIETDYFEFYTCI